ncbi:MAG: T9SS type A sorting domain-containing protein [Bacteroidota bacterium]|nr:T9SS type A sorting domain-containing protein [Bacteroidota bacterium]
MKKQLLTILSFGAFVVSNAQITITQADIAPIGFFMPRGIDTAFTETPIGPGGSNMVWDFSGIVDDRGDTITFVDPATLPGANEFPTSNLGIVISGQGYAFAESSASDLKMVGQGADFQGNPLLFKLNPAERIFQFPSTMGTAWSGTSVASSNAIPFPNPPVDSARITITTTKDASVDAWGSLTTPMGVYNVIRQKEIIHTQQDVEVYMVGPFPPAGWYPYAAGSTTDSSIKFTYIANGIGFPLMEIDSTSDGNVDVTWLITTPQVGLNEFSKVADTRVFPNPASDNLFIKLEKSTSVSVEIYDLQGKLVQQLETKGAVAQVNVSKLEKGLYVYKVTANDGSFATQGKFVVTR